MSGRDGGEEPLDWKGFLSEFHRTRAGVAEAVLSRATAGDHSPYRWLGRAVSADARVIVDLAAGSGPMSRVLAQPGRTVVGVDLSAEELALAAERGPGPWVRGDALRLPFRDGSVDVVTSSMGLVVVRPLEELLTEITRVLRPGGVLAAIAPAVRPLGPPDLLTLGQISRRLRAKPRFPGPVELAGFHKTLDAVGLTRVEDKRERYRFSVRSREDAELVMSALYLPSTRRSRVVAAVEYLEDRLERSESVEIAIPMRRVVAIK
ncbi:class I SAM-dependent methyltransferase [Microlunatus capsulatus]|uniref:SAM-dependent methyltransferase n=1 Tax=Microlunatus capsulatus TaxID=99117 RepID=A0ABS4ZAL4_9ACTN|nr:class I SAM-dependent methyltransferase [Microlunatus capsulatus]MBP2418004.1 SAM-dependent methyltransferase [Microlunatus capsulatus]